MSFMRYASIINIYFISAVIVYPYLLFSIDSANNVKSVECSSNSHGWIGSFIVIYKSLYWMIMEKATVHCPTIIPCHLIRNADTFLGLHSCIWQHYLFIVWTIYLQYHGIIYVFILIIVTDFISAALVLLNVRKWS